MPLRDWRSLPRKPRPDLAERNRQNATHGLSGSPTRKSWEAMKRRCLDPRDKDYANYGGRGITICPRWADSFEAFVADMGVKPNRKSLGRIDNDGSYEPGNCQWETASQQTNNRRSSRTLTAGGRTQTVAQWAQEIGISRNALLYRLNAGWPVALALDPEINHGRRRIE